MAYLKAAFIVILISVGLFVPFRIGIYERMSEHFFDLCHLPFFALITYFVLKETKYRLKAVIALIFFGCGIEVIQFFTGRSASLGDITSDILGITFGYLIFKAPKFIFLYLISWIAISYPSIIYFKKEYDVYRWRIKNFPVLFDKNLQPTWEYIQQTKSLNSEKGELFFRSDDDYVGVEYSPSGEDWSKYKFLSIQLSSHCPFRIRIDDKDTDESTDSRFTSVFDPTGDPANVKIDLSKVVASDRPLNLKDVERLIIYLPPESSCNEFTLHKVELLN